MKSDLHFQACQRCTDAVVYPQPKGQMGIVLAIKLQTIRLAKFSFIPVATGIHQLHFRAALELHATKIKILQHPALKHRQRCVIAQHFFDRALK